MSLISVIIPVYNRLEYISEAINSVLAQTYKNYEIIVVNDGSITNVKQVLESYMEKIKYLCQKHKGLAAARNTGIKHSNGKYLAFLDDDDLFEPRKLEKQVEVLNDYSEIGFVYSDGYVFNRNNPFKLKFNPTVARDSQDNEFVKLFFWNTNVFVSSTLIRRECFDDVGLFDESLPQHEDSDMLLRIALKWNVKFSNYPSTKIRHHSNRMSLDRIELYNSVLLSWQKILKLYHNFKKELGINANKRIAELHYLLALAYIRKRKFNEAKRELDICLLSSKSVLLKARLCNLILQTSHPHVIFNLLSRIKILAKIFLMIRSS